MAKNVEQSVAQAEPQAEAPKKAMTSLELDAERAKIRQKMLRAEAPKGVRVGKMWKNPLDALVALYCPECVGPHKTHDAFTGDPDLHRDYINQGYEPVIAEGQHVRNGRDLLYRRPKDFLDNHIKDAEARSHQRMAEAVNDTTEKETLVAPSAEVTRGM